MDDCIKAYQEQMEKMKTELGTTKNNFKKAEINIEKLNETLNEMKVINHYENRISAHNKQIESNT